VIWRDGKPYVRTRDAARMLAGSDDPDEVRRAHDRIRSWTRRKLLHPTNDGVGRMGRLGCLYSWDEIATVARHVGARKTTTRRDS
jgi:hypothetical protein